MFRSLTKALQLEVTTILEKKSLSKISYVPLFDKLQEHEIELEKLERHEDERKN